MMKVFRKWLVIATSGEKKGVTASYDSKKAAEAALNELFQKLDENLWGNSKGNRFHIEETVFILKRTQRSTDKERN